MPKIADILAQNVKALRAGMSQPDLAAKAGVNVSVIRALERDKDRRWPGLDKIALLARALGVEESDLFASGKSAPIQIPMEHGIEECLRRVSARVLEPEKAQRSLADQVQAMADEIGAEAFVAMLREKYPLEDPKKKTGR